MINATSPVFNRLPALVTTDFFCAEKGIAQSYRRAVELSFRVLPENPATQGAMRALFELFNQVNAKPMI